MESYQKKGKYGRPLRLDLSELGIIKERMERVESNAPVHIASSDDKYASYAEIGTLESPITTATALENTEEFKTDRLNTQAKEMTANTEKKKTKSSVAKSRHRNEKGLFVPKSQPEVTAESTNDELKTGKTTKTKLKKVAKTNKTKGRKKVSVEEKDLFEVNAFVSSEDLDPKGESKAITRIEEPKSNVKKISSTEEKLVIYSTTDYDSLVLEVSNRPIIQKKVDKLIADIKEKNLLQSFPIVVKSDMRIMDGQHRYSAAKALGVPIYYTINDNFEVDDIGKINSSTDNWSLSSFLHHFVKLSNKEYQTVSSFCEEHKMPLYNAIALMSGRTHQPNTKLIDEFKTGKFKVRNLEHALRVVKYRNDFVERVPSAEKFGSQKNFINAVSKFTAVDEYNHDMMCNKIERQPGELKKSNTTMGYLDEFVDIYNHHTPQKKRISKEKVIGI